MEERYLEFEDDRNHEPRIIILGAGPAGMGCAYTLAKAASFPLVIEKEEITGGLCRTINFHGYLFDIGGHRFLTKSEEINQLWHDILGNDLLRVRRLSRIFFQKKYFNYPLTFTNTFYQLGLLESLFCVGSYLKSRIFRPGDENTFEGWVTNRFGKRLYEIFFKAYTEKVWGIACMDLSADWRFRESVDYP